MSIFDKNEKGLNKIEVAIENYRLYEKAALNLNEEGYYIAYSGGKDSLVIAYLAILAGVKFRLYHNHTTVDAPELVRHVKDMKKWFSVLYDVDVEIVYPEKSMWQLIPERRMPPTRLVRYCCDYLKEGGGIGRFVVTGVRWKESTRRKNTRQGIEFDRYGGNSKKAREQRELFLNNDNDEKRRMLETCQIKGKHILNPIIDWSDDEVWEFIRYYELPYCKLYDEGYTRLGCIGCPMATRKKRIKEFERYPKYKENYKRAFKRMLEARKERGLKTDWETADEVMDWWLSR